MSKNPQQTEDKSQCRYDEVFLKTQSKESSLRESLKIFISCQVLNQLQTADYERIVEILKNKDDHKKIIETNGLRMNSQTSLKSFKNLDLLKKMASVGKGQSSS